MAWNSVAEVLGCARVQVAEDAEKLAVVHRGRLRKRDKRRRRGYQERREWERRRGDDGIAGRSPASTPLSTGSRIGTLGGGSGTNPVYRASNNRLKLKASAAVGPFVISCEARLDGA
jgi:hypothetical protein